MSKVPLTIKGAEKLRAELEELKSVCSTSLRGKQFSIQLAQ